MCIRDSNHTAVLLDTFLVTLFDAISNGDGVAGAEFGMLLSGSKCLLGYFDKIHFLKL